MLVALGLHLRNLLYCSNISFIAKVLIHFEVHVWCVVELVYHEHVYPVLLAFSMCFHSCIAAFDRNRRNVGWSCCLEFSLLRIQIDARNSGQIRFLPLLVVVQVSFEVFDSLVA